MCPNEHVSSRYLREGFDDVRRDYDLIIIIGVFYLKVSDKKYAVVESCGDVHASDGDRYKWNGQMSQCEDIDKFYKEEATSRVPRWK